jgi:2-methylcitrate dehydratase PrpD
VTASLIESEPTSDDGVAELAALADYCLAPDDELLAPTGHALWASARLLDGLAVIAHGSATAVSEIARTALPAGPGGIHAWPDVESSYRADDVAFLLGIYAFSENYADTGLGSVAHVNSIVVPALLLAMQQRPVSGRKALAALVVGYNVMEWVGGSLNGGKPRMAHQLRGFRPTPSAGPIAAVAVLGRLNGCDVDQMRAALGLACSQAGGLRPTNSSPTSGIRIQSGEALRRAVHTLDLARAGITSHPNILRCPGGFFPAYGFGELGKYDIPVAGEANDAMTKVSMKLECTPHTLVTMLDAARAIANRRSFAVADVESVTVRVPTQHNVISGGDKPFPTSFGPAAAHVPYCIALAMVTRSNLFPSVISDGLSNDDVRALTPRVSLVVDDRLTEQFDSEPGSWPATIIVQWADGTNDTVAMDAPDGSSWTAAEAMEHAALKAVALHEGRAGSESELIEEFSGVDSWSDVWEEISALALTRSAAEVRVDY